MVFFFNAEEFNFFRLEFFFFYGIEGLIKNVIGFIYLQKDFYHLLANF